MNFGENLQNLRKLHNLSQEDLADKMDVSRQTISKWESGNAYPEMEKLITLCDLLDCSLDTLIKGKVQDQPSTDLKTAYETIKNRFSRHIALAIMIILLGTVALFSILNFGEAYNNFAIATLLVFVAVGVPLFVTSGIAMHHFEEKHPELPNFYSETELDHAQSKFSKLIATGITILIIGVAVFIALQACNLFDAESTWPIATFLLFAAIGVPIIVYAGIQEEKYNIAEYNSNNSKVTKSNQDRLSKICAVIMIIATIIYFILGFVMQLWQINWVIFPIGGMLCGIASIIIEHK